MIFYIFLPECERERLEKGSLSPGMFNREAPKEKLHKKGMPWFVSSLTLITVDIIMVIYETQGVGEGAPKSEIIII